MWDPFGQEWPWGGQASSVETGVTFLLCVLAAVPSHPYGLTLLNCDGHSMTLGWKVPKFSGGAPILGYYIDKREAHHKNWHEVNSSPIKERILTVGSYGSICFCWVVSHSGQCPSFSDSEFKGIG